MLHSVPLLCDVASLICVTYSVNYDLPILFVGVLMFSYLTLWLLGISL